MKWLTFYNSRKYLFRILITMALLVSLCLVFFSSVLYMYSKNKIFTMQQESTQNVLNQIHYNVDQLNNLVKNFTFSLYFQSDMTILMQSKDIDIFSLSNILTRLDHNVVSNSFVHSVFIYNSNNKCYYSTLGSIMMNCRDEPLHNEILYHLIQSRQSLPKLTLVPGTSNDYFSYFMYDSKQFQPGESILMVNVHSQWLFDNIQTMNALNNRVQPTVLLLDRDGKYIETDIETAVSDEDKRNIQRQLNATDTLNGYFILDGPYKKIVTYMTSQDNHWKVISIQSYDAVFGQIQQLLTVSILLLAIFIVIALCVSIFLAFRLYKPIGRLYQEVHKKSRSKMNLSLRGEDEVSFMSKMYNDVYDSLNQLMLKQSDQKNVVKNYYLRMLVTQPRGLPEEQFREMIDDHQAHLNHVGPYLVCILNIDDFNQFKVRFSKRDQQLIKFAIHNIASEIYARMCQNQPIDMREDHVAIILNVPESNEQRLLSDLTLLSEEIQRMLMDYYHVSITISLSNMVHLHHKIASGYEQALRNSLYRLVFGKASIITPAKILFTKDHDYYLPSDMERRVAETLKTNDLPGFKDNLNQIFEHISRVNYDSMVHNILHLVMVVNRTIHELNLTENEMNNIHIREFISSVLEKDTLDEIFQLFSDLAHRFIEQRKAYKENKNDFLVEAINEIIEKNYADSNLCLNVIADSFKMSPSYIGRIYRKSQSQSIANYLNEVRITHSMNLLRSSNDTISTIMQKVGYTNEGNFFRLFRKHTGMTPRDYRSRMNKEL